MKQTENNWLNRNQSIEQVTLIEVPKHRVYVDVLGNGVAFLLQKRKSRLEILNDQNNALVSFLLATRSNEQLVESLLDDIPTQQDALTRLRNLMIENVEVNRLVDIYDGPDTLFYIDMVHYEGSEKEQTEVLMQLAALEGKVMLLAPSNLMLPEWYKVTVSDEVHLLMNYQNEQMSLFAFASMEGVLNND